MRSRNDLFAQVLVSSAMGLMAAGCGPNGAAIPADGGDGGDGGGATTDAVTTPTVTATVGSGGGGNVGSGAGGGDSGGGGASSNAPPGCDEITIGTLLADSFFDYYAFSNFTGTTKQDGFRVYIGNNVEGTITLGAGTNASALSCEQCVVTYVDIGATGGYSTLMFAQSGTLTLPTGGAGTATLSDVVVRELDKNTLELVPNGDCLYLAGASFAYDNPVPPGWYCGADFYDAADGCDCDCGAPDPDCDLIGQDIYGCYSGQTCEDGVCTTPPETACDSLYDEDQDGSVDCGDADCAVSADCIPGVTPRDGACDAASDCDTVNGSDPFCLPWGYAPVCSEWCSFSGTNCGVGAVCLDIGFNQGICLTECLDASDCAVGFDCLDVDGFGTLACLTVPPPPPSAWVCTAERWAADDGCECGCGAVDPDCASPSDQACDYCDQAASCGNDGTMWGCDLTALVDTDNATCL